MDRGVGYCPDFWWEVGESLFGEVLVRFKISFWKVRTYIFVTIYKPL